MAGVVFVAIPAMDRQGFRQVEMGFLLTEGLGLGWVER